jgi:hypothetical protein
VGRQAGNVRTISHGSAGFLFPSPIQPLRQLQNGFAAALRADQLGGEEAMILGLVLARGLIQRHGDGLPDVPLRGKGYALVGSAGKVRARQAHNFEAAAAMRIASDESESVVLGEEILI